MSDKTMKIILSVLTVILLALIVGLVAMKGGATKADLNKLALRIGELRQYRTMNRADVNAAMEKAFARVGYNVVVSTEDNLYPDAAKDAGVNLYIRGYGPYNEVKTNAKGVNVVYIRDYDSLFEEETKNQSSVTSLKLDSYINKKVTDVKKIMDEKNMTKDNLQWYMDLRRYGGCKHAGFGLGFDRFLMYLTGMQNIRDVEPFPRTPRNLKF